MNEHWRTSQKRMETEFNLNFLVLYFLVPWYCFHSVEFCTQRNFESVLCLEKKNKKKLKRVIILLIFVFSSSNWFPLLSIQEPLRSLAKLWTVWIQIPNPLLVQLFCFPYSWLKRNSRTQNNFYLNFYAEGICHDC